MTSQYPVIRRKLGKLRNHIRWMFVAHGMATVLMVLALLLIWHYLTDTFLELPLELRAGALVGMGVVLLVVLLRRVVYPLTRRPSDHELALLVEKEYPLLKDRLITALQFYEDRQRYQGFSSNELADSVIAEGFDVASRLRFKEVVQSGRLVLATGLAVAACAGLFALLAATWDTTSRYWVDRLLLSDVEYPRKTHLVVKFPTDLSEYPTRDVLDLNLTFDGSSNPPLITVARGTGVRVIATPTGKIPSEASIILRSDGESRSFPMRAERGGDSSGEIQHFSYNITSVLHERQEIWVEAGDAVEGPFMVRSVAAPTLRPGTEVVYEFPQYMRREPWRQLDVRALTAPEGAKATVVFQSDQELSEAKVRFYSAGTDPQEIVPEAVEGRPNTFSFSMALSDTLSEYEYILLGRNGLRNTESYRYTVRTEQDRAPEVTVEFHGKGLEDEGRVPVTLSGRVPLRFTVKDKYGVRLWRLAYRVPRDNEEWRWHQEFESLHSGRARAAEAIMQSGEDLGKWLNSAEAVLVGSGGDRKAAVADGMTRIRQLQAGVQAAESGVSRGLKPVGAVQVASLDRLKSLLATLAGRGGLAALEAGADTGALANVKKLAADITDAASQYWIATTRESTDEYVLSIESIAKDCGYESDAQIEKRAKDSGSIDFEVKIQALDFNQVSDRTDRGTGFSSTMVYSLTTARDLESQISRFIRSRLKEDFFNIQRAQTTLLDSTQIFIERRFSLDFGSSEAMSADALAGRQRLSSAQLSQARLPDDAQRLADRFGNVAQAYIFNEIEAAGSNKDQENAIHTIRLALALLTCDTSKGSLVASQVQAARSRGSDAAERMSAVEGILDTLGLKGGVIGVRESFRRLSFADYLANTAYDQPATLRLLDQSYRSLLKDEAKADDRRAALNSIAQAQLQTLEGLKVAAQALRKWEGFDQLREELQRMIDEESQIQKLASEQAAKAAGGGR